MRSSTRTSIGNTTGDLELPILMLSGLSNWVHSKSVPSGSVLARTISVLRMDQKLLDELEESHQELELGQGRLLKTLRDLR